MTPLSSEVCIILQSSHKCKKMDNGVIKSPKCHVINLSFLFLVACFNKTLHIKLLLLLLLMLLLFLLSLSLLEWGMVFQETDQLVEDYSLD